MKYIPKEPDSCSVHFLSICVLLSGVSLRKIGGHALAATLVPVVARTQFGNVDYVGSSWADTFFAGVVGTVAAASVS